MSNIPTHITSAQFLDEVWARYLEMEKDPDRYRPVASIVSELTERTGGYGAGMFGVYGAPPKGGKSAALVSSATHIARLRPTSLVGYISNEMWKHQLGRALLSNISLVDRNDLKHLHVSDGDKFKVENAIRDFGQGMNIRWGWNITKFKDVYTWVDDIQQKTGQKMDYIIIDYIHLMEGEGNSMTQKIPWITRTMKKMTQDFEGMMVLSAAQLNNDHIKREDWNHTAFLYGGVDRDADWGVIIAPHKDDAGRIVDGIKELHTPVVREGVGGMAMGAFRGEYSLIKGTTPEQEDRPDTKIEGLEYVV